MKLSAGIPLPNLFPYLIFVSALGVTLYCVDVAATANAAVTAGAR